MTNQLANIDDPILNTLNLNVLKLLETNDSIPRQVWEYTNGINLIRHFIKYFETNMKAFVTSIENISIMKDSPEINYSKLTIIYYFIYIYEEFSKILLSYASCMHNSTVLIQLTNRLMKILNPIHLKSQQLIPKLQNQLKILEIKSEVNGLPDDINLGNVIRFGILAKFNSKLELENRIFFLTTNYLFYGSRISYAVGFRLHGILSLASLKLEGNSQNDLPYSFSINTGGKLLLLSALTENVRDAWVKDLDEAIRKSEPIPPEILIKCDTSGIIRHQLNGGTDLSRPLTNHQIDNMLHISWIRNLNISCKKICQISKYTISGYLLRKFKNSAGWQRLFVSFNHVSLFFYKSHEDKNPLATLPILGYKIDIATAEDDGITKDFVFKILFKNHVYYFRTESPFTFKRWLHVLKQSTNLS